MAKHPSSNVLSVGHAPRAGELRERLVASGINVELLSPRDHFPLGGSASTPPLSPPLSMIRRFSFATGSKSAPSLHCREQRGPRHDGGGVWVDAGRRRLHH